MDISKLRNEYMQGSLDKSDLNPDPLAQFEKWFFESTNSQVAEPNAVQLATATKQGRPSVRTVLIKGFDQRGFTFYTNYGSRKGMQIAENPQASALFFWKELERQVEISGKIEKVSIDESTNYFANRPRGSQLGAWVSSQSKVIESRQVLEQTLAEMEQKFSDSDIPLPDFWGGYRIIPDTFEFWQGRSNRLHDRFEYRLTDEQQWKIVRISP